MSITAVEARIAVSLSRGEWADFRDQPTNARSVSGEFIRRLLLATPLPQSHHQAIADHQPAYARFRPSSDLAPVPVSAAGVRIRGAIIEGVLNLSNCAGGGGVSLPALALEECHLLGRAGLDERHLQDDEAMCCLDLSRASIASVSLRGSAFTYVTMFNARVDGAVNISGVKPLAGWEDRALGAGHMPAFRKAMLAASARLREVQTVALIAEPSSTLTTARTSDDVPTMPPTAYCWLDLANSHIQGSILAQNVRLRVPRRDRAGRSDVQLPARFALRLEAATVAGTLDARGGSVFDGGLSLYLADIRDEVWLGGGRLLKEDGVALDAQGARLGGIYAVATPPLRILGTVILSSARISGHVKLPAADLDGDGNSSLMADSSTIGGDVILNGGAAIRGPADLSGTTIGGTFDLRGAMLRGATRRDDGEAANERCDALHARNLSVGSDAFLSDGFIADGCVWLSGARIGDNLDLRGATLIGTSPIRYQSPRRPRDRRFYNQEEAAFSLSGPDIVVGGSLQLGSTRPESRGLVAQGLVNLQRASIGKDLEIVNARISPSPATASEARTVLDFGWVGIAGTLILKSNQFDGIVNFEHASTNVLADADESAYTGAAHVLLNGFNYKTFYEPPADDEASSVANLVVARTEWLRKMPGYRPQPYAHLAQVLIAHGRNDEARDVLIEKYRRERRENVRRLTGRLLVRRPGEFARTSMLSATSWFFGVTFGYGLKPSRAVRTLLVACIIGWVFFARANDRGAMVVDQQPIAGYVENDQMVALMASEDGTRGLRCSDNISPALYALDVFIPLVDLRQESKCEIGRANDATLYEGVTIGDIRIDEVAIGRFFKALYALSGWLLISLAILTFSGVLQRQVAER